MATNTSQFDPNLLKSLGVNFLVDQSTGKVRANYRGGFGFVGGTSGPLAESMDQLIASGVSQDLFRTGNFRTQDQINEAGGSNRPIGIAGASGVSSITDINTLFRGALNPIQQNITNALQAQQGDRIAVGNEDYTRADLQRILGQDIGFTQSAADAQVAAGQAAAAAKDARVAAAQGVAPQAGRPGAVGRQGEGLNIAQQADGTYSVVGADTGRVYSAGLASTADALAAQQELGSGAPAQAQGAFAPQTTDLEVELPDTLSTEELSDALTDVTTDSDIQGLLESSQQQVLDAMQPTDREVDIQAQLSVARQAIDDVVTSFELGVAKIEGQPIPMQFIQGQALAVEKLAQIQLSAAQRTEANLLQGLGIELGNRELQLAAAQTQYSFLRDNIDLAFQVQDRLTAEEDRVLARADKLTAENRELLSTMLGSFEGYDMEMIRQLNPQAASELEQLAIGAGISVGLLEASLSVVKNQMAVGEVGLGSLAELGVNAAGETIYSMVDELSGETRTGTLDALTPPSNGSAFSSSLGDGDLVFYGSSANDAGLDLALSGGVGAEVNLPFNFSINSAVDTCQAGDSQCNGGWGNSIVGTIEAPGTDYDDQEFRISHLDSIAVGPGSYRSGTLIGAQGNTGKVMGSNEETLSANQIASGRGAHLDITMKGMSAEKVGRLLGVRKPGSQADGGGDKLTDTQFKNLNTLGDDLRQDPSYKDASQSQGAYFSVLSGREVDDSFGDLLMINGFQKIADPGVSVREGEFQTVAAAQGYLQEKLNLPKKYFSGDRLTNEGRNALFSAATIAYDNKVVNFNSNVLPSFVRRGSSAGIPSSFINDWRLPESSTINAGSVEEQVANELISGGQSTEDPTQFILDTLNMPQFAR